MMNFITKLLTSPTTEALGWTLLHSFWFGFLCFSITWLALRLLPSRMSDLRYAVATAGLLFILLSSAVIFALMLPTGISDPVVAANNNLFRLAAYQVPQETSHATPGILATVTGFIHANMSLIVFIWVIGALLTSLKVFGGYWYVARIRSGSRLIIGSWEEKIQSLAERLGVYRYVVLAESTLIQAPVVMGYIKPMILVPVGMMSGLTTEQLETIFIHELIHIRRGDYIVNIFQSFLEAIYFFNPFVWALSDMMRREREHCCDDAVVELHGNPLVYVKALASLEEVRLTRAGVALSLAEDKNHLLKRIKRIMEKSVQRYSGRDKLVPAVLLVLGLTCASWLTIQTETRSQQPSANEPLASDNLTAFGEAKVVADTTIKDRSAHKKTIIRIHENGDSETFEVYDDGEDDDDSDMHFMMPGMSMHFAPVPPIPPIDPIDINFHFEMPEIPEIPAMDFSMHAIDPMEPMDIHLSIPPIPAIAPMNFNFPHMMIDTVGPHHWNNRDWDEFGKEFEKSFREKFEGFYEQHQEEMEELLERLQEKYDNDHDGDDEDRDNDREEWGAAAREHQSRDVNKQVEMIKRQNAAVANMSDKLREQDRKALNATSKQMDAMRRQEELAVLQAYKAHEFENAAFNKNNHMAMAADKVEKIAQLANNQKEFAAGVAQMKVSSDQWTKDWTQRWEESQQEAKKELVKDGYLKDADKINNIDISNDEITVNGIKIKDADQKKYMKLLGQDLRHPGRME